MACTVSCRNLVKRRIRRSAAARQERERPFPVNRRNAQAAWRMIDSKYQIVVLSVKGALFAKGMPLRKLSAISHQPSAKNKKLIAVG